MDFNALNTEEEKQKLDLGKAETGIDAVKITLQTLYGKKFKEMQNKVSELQVKDEPSLALATEYRSGVRKLTKEIEARRDAWIFVEKEWVNSVRSLAKTLLDPLKYMDDELKKKQAMGHAEIRRQQAEKEAKMRKEAEALQKKLDKEAKAGGYEAPQVPEMVSPEPKKAVRTESGASSSYKTKWKAKIKDPEKVPREYCSPDMKKLQYAVDNGIRKIDGCVIEEEIIPIQRG